MARALNDVDLATLLIDLLTPHEERALNTAEVGLSYGTHFSSAQAQRSEGRATWMTAAPDEVLKLQRDVSSNMARDRNQTGASGSSTGGASSSGGSGSTVGSSSSGLSG
jgi:hypothetical protein